MVKVPSLSNTEQDIQHTRHKEEVEGRIMTDQADRQSLGDTLDVCIDPLEYASQPDGALMNIVTGQSAHPDVNADNAVNLGHRAMENFQVNAMLTEAFSTQATLQKQHRRTPLPFPVSAMYQLR